MLKPSSALEAILFASGEPVDKQQLRKLLHLEEGQLVEVVSELERELSGRGLALVETADDVELRTAPGAAELVKKLRENELARDLGKASIETLAVVAYRPGSTRSEIDWVRGVNSSASVRTLLLRGLIEGSEDPNDKRRVRYSLTVEALAHLGLSRVEDLPRYTELHEGAVAVNEETGA